MCMNPWITGSFTICPEISVLVTNTNKCSIKLTQHDTYSSQADTTLQKQLPREEKKLS